ncbi:MAG: hypothetical protein Fur0041_11560 [Bacteroidia bacterium]
MKYGKEIRTGVVVIMAVALFIYGFNFLKGRDIFSTSLDLYAVYDHVDGLTANNNVVVNGFKVGSVRDVNIDPKTGKLVVHFIITDKNFIVNKGMEAMIFSDGLLGNRAIQLMAGKGGKPVEDGDTLKGINDVSLKDQVNEQLLPLKNKVEGLVGSIDSIVSVFMALMDEKAVADIEASFTNIRLALENFSKTSMRLDTMVNKNSKNMNEIVFNLKSFSAMMEKNKDTLAMALSNIKNITDSLSKSNLKNTIDNASVALAKASLLLDRMNKEGMVDVALGKDSMVVAELKYTNARMEFLLADIANYPGIYIPFKKKPNKKEQKIRQQKIQQLDAMKPKSN